MPRPREVKEKYNIDALVDAAVFGDNPAKMEETRRQIVQIAAGQGAFPASIQGLYEAAGKGLYHGMTVPAINIRGITYDVARAVFRAALKTNTGAFSFEIARSEIGYTRQSPSEYAAAVLAAAVKENFRGPVFIQGDHFQVKRSTYLKEPKVEVDALKELIRQAINAGFYNIDIDASTVVDISKKDLSEQQEYNSKVTAELTKFIREIEPKGITVSVGGEIGEIGKGNSTVEDLRAFADGYRSLLPKGVKGISKISVQTGTTHGGVVLPDGSIKTVSIAFETLKELSKMAREAYGMGGAVQHGASTLPDEAFDMFPKVETVEVHLATGFQNIIYDSRQFPAELLAKMNQFMDAHYADEKVAGETQEQFIYKTRKKAFGDFKKELWHIPDSRRNAIMQELEERFTLIFRKLNAVNTKELVAKYVK
jgi:fructose/tagatose bisphosphate aldolase